MDNALFLSYVEDWLAKTKKRIDYKESEKVHIVKQKIKKRSINRCRNA